MVYHSHKHGATAMQVMGGIGGMLIVEDTEEETSWLPREYLDAREVRMLMATVQPAVLLNMAFNTNDTLLMGDESSHPLCDAVGAAWNPAGSNCTLSGNPIGADCSNSCGNGAEKNRDFTLVNSQLRPLVEMEAGVFQRWRIAYLASKRYVNLVISDDLSTLAPSPDCELQLIAKDGIYLNYAPREVPSVIVASGNRADVMVRCSRSTWPGVNSSMHTSST